MKRTKEVLVGLPDTEIIIDFLDAKYHITIQDMGNGKLYVEIIDCETYEDKIILDKIFERGK